MRSPIATAHSQTMRAAIVEAPGLSDVARVPLPQPAPREVRVRIESCGVCASNLSPWQGAPWFTYPLAPGALGHEATGFIDALGAEVEGWQLGQRVGLLSGHAYAEYDVASVEAMVLLPPELDGRPFPAEPLGCAMNIFRRAQIREGDHVAIVGAGFLGLLLVQLARDAGARVTAIGRRPFACELARELGAENSYAFDDHAAILSTIKELTRDRLCDVTIECVGKQTALDLATELTGERGRMVVAGYHQDGLRQVNMQLWNWRGLDVINAHERDPQIYLRGMREAVQAVLDGRLKIDRLITHQLPLEALGQALDLTRDRPEGFLKALITM